MKMFIRLCVLSGILTFCFFGGCFTNNATASLINGNFHAGFDGWSGDLVDVDYNYTIVNANDYNDNFASGHSGATLTTAGDFWSVFIYQELLVPEGATTLSFNIEYSPTSKDGEFVQALMGGINLLGSSFVNGLISTDISGLAGHNARLEFGLQDFDFVLGDTLTISSIQFNTTPVPIPGTLPLMAAGLLGLGLFRYRRDNKVSFPSCYFSA